MVEIRHEFYEKGTGDEYPILVHVFFGKTLKEAKKWFRAHSKYDEMFRESAYPVQGNAIEAPDVKEGIFRGIQYKRIIRVVGIGTPSSELE
jgi:hypothetical protein